MLRLLTKMNRKTRSNERRETTRADLRSTAALFEKVGEKGVRICDAVGLHHRGPHLYRLTEHDGRRLFDVYFTNLANVVDRNRCRMSRGYAEIQQSGRGKFEKVGEKGVRNCDAVVLYHILDRGRHL